MKERDPLDAAVLPCLRPQRNAAPAPPASLQPRQFPAYASPAGGCRAPVADYAAGKACQDPSHRISANRARSTAISATRCSAHRARSCPGSTGSGRGHFPTRRARPSVSAAPQEGCARDRSLGDSTLRGYRGVQNQRGSASHHLFRAGGLVARTHGEHDGCSGTCIWGIPGRNAMIDPSEHLRVIPKGRAYAGRLRYT
jgi:hypothetical protein